jgi:flagellar M-ring protein FliF
VIKTLWEGLGRGARAGLVIGTVLIVALTAAAAWWVLRAEYEVLFADLAPQDAIAMAAELERLKVPFVIAEEQAGTTIRVEKKDVYPTRIKLMGKDIPLHGAIGFELFNHSDFGMTEFAQKINYQRALQGELTRTILSLAEIRDARVLLALPEQGLFKQATTKAKASITLTLKRGLALRPEQVVGIQRLVAAAVPGITAQDVTIVDQTGVALTRSGSDGEAEGSSWRLDLKKDTEAYLTRKATQVLERALGAGQALASVDVTLDMNRVQSTTEDVVGAPGAQGRAQTGVVVRQRVVTRELGTPLARGDDPASGSVDESSQREVEYAVGRRVEQVIGQPGSITRIQVVAVVRKPLEAREAEQIRSMVAASVGASSERGDTVVVQPLGSAPPRDDEAALPPEPEEPRAAVAAVATPPAAHPALLDLPAAARTWMLVAAGVLAGALLPLLLRRPDARRSLPAGERALNDAERKAALAQVQAWLRGDPTRSRREAP